MEDNEDAISTWYFGEQQMNLQEDVCSKVVAQQECLSQPYGEDVVATPKPSDAKGDFATTPTDRDEL